ncbi:MAG: hypothetical protein KGI67_13625 [Pseudomonadota bacterium]|nr:hypothetical protein [Pseudomonadota bacterium]
MIPATHEECACPFCGLACDDLTLTADAGGITAGGGACERARRSYAQVGAAVGSAPRAWIGGQPATLEAALDHAAGLLGSAHAPLFGGLATDVLGMRGLMDLADHCGAVLDHMNAEAKLRNLRCVQDQGWITTTLSEVRNHADLVVCFGGAIVDRFPRFFERCVWVAEPMFAPAAGARQVVCIGPRSEHAAAVSPAGCAPEWIEIPQHRLAEAAALLRGLAARSLPAGLATDLPLDALTALVERLRVARYGVLAWAAPDLDWPQADLTVQALASTITTLNATTRCAGLPLGGSDGDFSADAVLLWQTGYPFRISLASGTGRYDPVGLATERLLRQRDVDLLLWVSCFDPARSLPAERDCPLVALTCIGTPVLADAAVQIMVATPGIDAAGYLFRADKVVTLPLRASIDRQLPAVGDLARRLLAGLKEATC